MDSKEKHIVAIDLGSSKIALTVAKVNGDIIEIIYYKETPSEGIRYSKIYNVMLVGKSISEAISLAEKELNIKITQAIIGMPRYPISQETSNATIPDRGESTMILKEDIKILKDFAHSLYPLKDEKKEAIFGSVAQSFSDGEEFQVIENDIIGMTSDVLEGNFKIFIGKKSDLNKIDTVMTNVEVAPMRKYFTAESTAKAVLSDSEIENGVALIDFGGGCTSVSIFEGNIMRHYASIPFGGKNITQDIKLECQISEKLAENIKLAYGACMPDKLHSLSDKILNIKGTDREPDKQITVKYLSEIISARLEEILMAVLYEIEQSGYADSLRGGIVVTGGVANTTNICNYITHLSGYKARIGYPNQFFSYMGCENIIDTTSTTSLGLILASIDDETVNCTIPEIDKEHFDVITEGFPEVELEEHGVPAGENGKTQGELFDENEIEKISDEELKKKKEIEKNNHPRLKIIFTKVKEAIGNLYENVNSDEEDENKESYEE